MKVYLFSSVVLFLTLIWTIKEALHSTLITKRIEKRLKEINVELWKKLNNNAIAISKWVSEDVLVDDELLCKLRKNYRKRSVWFGMAITSFLTSSIFLMIIF